MTDFDGLARVRVTFPGAPSGLPVSDVLRMLSALTYEYDVVALLQGAEPVDTARDYEPSTEIPGFRPRWSPRLQDDGLRLRVAAIDYGSPLMIDVLGDPSVLETWLKALVGTGGVVVGVERLATMPSRIRARIEQNRADANEARARSAAAEQRIRKELGDLGDPRAEVDSELD